MIFKDEKRMWYADTEILAEKLQNKSKWEILDILNKGDVITLRVCDRPKVNILGRLLLPSAWLFYVFLWLTKWVLTGQGYLDSWFIKYPRLESLAKFTGLSTK